MDPSDVAAAFDGLRKGGLVRAFGVSNFTPSQCELLRATATDAVSINQVRFTPIGGGRWAVGGDGGGGAAHIQRRTRGAVYPGSMERARSGRPL